MTMATVTGLIADRIIEVENATINDGKIVTDSLILMTRDGTEIDAGLVRGPQGIQGDTGSVGPTGNKGPTGPQGAKGPTGPQGTQGSPGPAGEGGLAAPYSMIPPASSVFEADGVTDLVRNFVPTTGHLYAAHVNVAIKFESLIANGRWDLYFRVNSSNSRRSVILQPGTVGTSYHDFDTRVFWTAPNSTSVRFDIYAKRVTAGACNITLMANRSFNIFDYGIAPAGAAQQPGPS
jgi:Collagen triple helix repeat (20 copies)